MKDLHWDSYTKDVAIQTFMQDIRLSYIAKCIMASYLHNPDTNLHELLCESTDYQEFHIREAIEELYRLGYIDLLHSILNQVYDSGN